MRIIGTIEHPTLKISVFKNDGRTSLKIETPLYEQTFKLGTDERFATPEGVQKLVDEQFLEEVLATFEAMHRARLAASNRLAPLAGGEVFETII